MASDNLCSLLPLSKEEDDLLRRSHKKLKNDDSSLGKQPVQEEWPKVGAKVTSYVNGGPSFSEKLKGSTGKNDSSSNGSMKTSDGATEDDMSQDEQDDDDSEPLFRVEEDLTRNFPTFIFSEKMKRRLYRSWRKSLIVKLLDRSIGYKALLSRLQSMWAKKGVLLSLIDIGHGFYVVKFSNKEDYTNALTGGPWMIYDHYLSVRPWEPNFSPATAKIDKVAVWVRMPKIFLEFYDREALRIIGDRIGDILKIDVNTASHQRGHYARICVMLDLQKQLMAGFCIDGREYYLEYENLPLLCYNCGFYGHIGDLCPAKKKQSSSDEVHGGAATCDLKQNGTEAAYRKEESSSSRDYWRTVQRHRRPRKTKEAKESLPKQDGNGSRFQALAEDDGGQGNVGETEMVVVSETQLVVNSLPSQVETSTRAIKRSKKGSLLLEKDSHTGKEAHSAPRDNHPMETRNRVEKRTREVKTGQVQLLTWHSNVVQKEGYGQPEEGIQKEVIRTQADGMELISGAQIEGMVIDPGENNELRGISLDPGIGPLPIELEAEFVDCDDVDVPLVPETHN